MKAEDLRKMGEKELESLMRQESRNTFKYRYDVKNQQSKNSHLIKKNRRDVARIKTIQTEKKLEKKA